MFSMKALLYLFLIYYLSMEKHFSQMKKNLDSFSYAFHCPVMDHAILEDPQAVRYCQEVGNNSCGPRCSCVARGDAGQMVLLQTGPFCCKLSKGEG